jgi:hypothetical protein
MSITPYTASAFSPVAAPVTAGIGQSAHTLFGSAAETASKVMQTVHAYFAKTVFMARIFIHMAWSATKNFVSNAAGKTVELVANAAQAVIGFCKTCGTKSLEIASKVIQCVGNFLSKVFVGIWTGAKDGAVQGYQITKNFLGTHQKEAIIAGTAIIVGLAVYYAAARLYAAHHQPVAV